MMFAAHLATCITASAAHLADGERLISNEKYIFEFEYIYIGTE